MPPKALIYNLLCFDNIQSRHNQSFHSLFLSLNIPSRDNQGFQANQVFQPASLAYCLSSSLLVATLLGALLLNPCLCRMRNISTQQIQLNHRLAFGKICAFRNKPINLIHDVRRVFIKLFYCLLTKWQFFAFTFKTAPIKRDIS